MEMCRRAGDGKLPSSSRTEVVVVVGAHTTKIDTRKTRMTRKPPSSHLATAPIVPTRFPRRNVFLPARRRTRRGKGPAPEKRIYGYLRNDFNTAVVTITWPRRVHAVRVGRQMFRRIQRRGSVAYSGKRLNGCDAATPIEELIYM